MSLSSRVYQENHHQYFQGIESQHHEEKDLISNLPDAVISHILSCLPAKYAVQTSILSKNWEHKWTSIYNFIIDDDYCELEVGEVRNNSFLNFVDRILDGTDNSRIRNFYLYAQQNYDPLDLTRWMDIALRRKVEKLNIYYYPEFPYCPGERITLPESIYSCDTLTELEISLNCTIEVPLLMNCFSQLKTLYITNSCNCGSMGNVEILNVQSFSGGLILDFPVLEELTFGSGKWLNVKFLEINAPVLVSFCARRMNTNLNRDDFEIKISAPMLAKFFTSGNGPLPNFVLSSSSLVYHATLRHMVVYGFVWLRANNILKSLPSLKHLTISGHIMQALIRAKKRGSVLATFCRLKELKIYRGCTDGSDAFLEFLEMVPYIEFLSLDMEYWHCYEYELVESLPSCLVTHLKELEITFFRKSENQVDVLKFIWKNGKKLEKLHLVLAFDLSEKEIDDVELLLSELPNRPFVTIKLSIYDDKDGDHLHQLWPTSDMIRFTIFRCKSITDLC